MKKMVVIAGLSILGLWGFIKPAPAEIKNITLRVDGLACPFCAYGLEKKITKLKSVSTYDVNMKEGKVFIGIKPEAAVDISSLYKAVKEAGFTLKSIFLRAKGRVKQAKEGLLLVFPENNQQFLLFENEVLLKKYHSKEPPILLKDDTRRKLIEAKERGKEVLVEGFIHQHKGAPAGLSLKKLDIVE